MDNEEDFHCFRETEEVRMATRAEIEAIYLANNMSLDLLTKSFCFTCGGYQVPDDYPGNVKKCIDPELHEGLPICVPE